MLPLLKLGRNSFSEMNRSMFCSIFNVRAAHSQSLANERMCLAHVLRHPRRNFQFSALSLVVEFLFSSCAPVVFGDFKSLPNRIPRIVLMAKFCRFKKTIHNFFFIFIRLRSIVLYLEKCKQHTIHIQFFIPFSLASLSMPSPNCNVNIFVGETLLSWFSYNFNYLRKKMFGKIYLFWAKYLFKTKNHKTIAGHGKVCTGSFWFVSFVRFKLMKE